MSTRFDKTIGPPPSFRGDEYDPELQAVLKESAREKEDAEFRFSLVDPDTDLKAALTASLYDGDNPASLPTPLTRDEDDPQIREVIARSLETNVEDETRRAVKEKNHIARNNTMVANMLSKLRKQDARTAPMASLEGNSRIEPPKRSILSRRSHRQIAPAPPTNIDAINIDAINIDDVPIKRSRSLFGRLFGQSTKKGGGNVRKQRKSRKQIKSRKMRKQRKQRKRRKSKRVSY